MEPDPEIKGWLSVTNSLNDLYKWFPKEDIYELQKHKYAVFAYQAEEVRFYERFQHLIIRQETAKPLFQMILLNK